MIKNIIIASQLFIIIFCTFVIVYVENQRYALQSGMCADSIIGLSCYDNAQTRTHWGWHLFFASNDSISWLGRYNNFSENGSWEAIVYPRKSDLKDWLLLGEFGTLTDCREASKAYLTKIGSVKTGDYECALECKIDEYGRLCKATQQ